VKKFAIEDAINFVQKTAPPQFNLKSDMKALLNKKEGD
jgi:hypothetical protein